jgi:hypothetical protein
MAGPGWIVHVSSSLRYGLGLPLLLAGVAGLALYVRRNRRAGVLFAIFPIGYYAFLGVGETAFARYIIPVVPFLCLAAAYGVVAAANRIGEWLRHPQAIPAVAWTLAAAVVAPSFITTVQTDMLLSRTDNRLIAADWIHQRYPSGATIAQTGTVAGQVQMATADPEHAERYVPLKFEPESGRFFTPDDRDGSPDLIVVEQCPLAYCNVPDQWRTVLRDRYEIEGDFPAYIASSDALVYDRDDDFYLPLAGLSDVMRPGPNITIYRRRPDSRD